jgi:heme/copper-type cytochrome/quinol oxidase subunit 2
MKSVYKFLTVGMLVVMLLPVLAHGQFEVNPLDGSDPNGTITDIVDTVVAWAFGLLLVLAVVFIIWAAFLYLTSGGDEEKTAKAKGYIYAAVIAIVIAALARVIVAVVKYLLNIPG